MKSPKVRTAVVTVVLIALALAWESFGLATGESGAWTFSRLVWSLTDNELFVFSSGVLMGHWFFPKTKCLHCGFLPYRTNEYSRVAFDRALQYFAIEYPLGGPYPSAAREASGAFRVVKEKAGFPNWSTD